MTSLFWQKIVSVRNELLLLMEVQVEQATNMINQQSDSTAMKKEIQYIDMINEESVKDSMFAVDGSNVSNVDVSHVDVSHVGVTKNADNICPVELKYNLLPYYSTPIEGVNNFVYLA